MDLKNIGALIYLPSEKKIERYSADSMESFDEIDAYWLQREGLLFYPFDRSKQAYFFSDKKAENEIKEFDLSPNESLTQTEYETSVYMACAEMQEGTLDKVVLARNEILEGEYNAQNSFQNAVKNYPDSYGYYVNIGPEEWVGASPELLIHYEEGVLYTVALAGTKSLQDAFTEKEREEQEMVSDFIEAKLQIVGLSSFTKSEVTEAIFGEIKHLKTAYTVQADKIQALELLKHLQPTSAVCGLPRDKSFAFIQEFETMNRSFYSGLTGVLRKESATFFVNLRCMRFYGKNVELFAGAGITKDSDPTAEWEETEKKIATIRELL
ncbi:chorismate-binding protein [Bacteroidia bacterium]|nr:chorismate-binding protein [Bacteroidia bacterium]MDB9882830.1 chorismate-binding protein [Bacteroidia bacterium]MDC1394946.1 chorismate-binding protein [Bacteroidia bacterium]